MARSRNEAKAQTATECDYCNQAKGRNAQIAHFLRFENEESLKRHLQNVLDGADKDGRIDHHLKFYSFVHRYYGQAAREKYQPLWLVYLEATGARVVDRDKWIIRHRNKNAHPLPLP